MPLVARSGETRLRVLTLTRDIGFGFGGAERIAFEFARRLDRSRFRSYVCITRSPTPGSAGQTAADVAQLREEGIPVLRLERGSTATLAPWARLLALLVRERIDIVHAHMPRASIPGTVLGRIARVPVIVSQEHIWSSHRRPERQFLHRNIVGRFSDVLLAVSERNRLNIIEAERIAPARIRVLPNAIDSFAVDGAGARASLGIPAREPLVGAIGRLTWEKGHDDLIAAVDTMGRAAPRCVIAGGGPEEARLRREIDALALHDRVELLGQRTDARQLIGAFDVAVLPSKTEGSPLALLEYMASGAPIVATAVGGIPELVQDGVHGLLVAPRDPAALAGAISRLLEDRELAARLGANARARQRAEFDLDVVVRSLERLYLELWERARASSNSGIVR
ncbi:MAG: glycosyltransferase [Solirubrobacterales bacterium]|nr:glycosyltransferase [Solirubrobacterales bacterium]MBV9919208.1 glycosyltransferase [Solirubrobacterales bacterium]